MNLPPIRYIILFLMVLSITVDFITRVNINVAIVSMVNHSGSSSTSGNRSFDYKYNVCPVPVSNFKNSSNGSNSSTGLRSSTAPRYDWSQKTQGIILGAFFYPYVIAQIPASLLATNYGGKWVIATGILFSGVVNLLTPFAASSTTLLVLTRVVLGIVQGGIYPSSYGLVHKWFPKSQRSVAYALIDVGGALGAIIATSSTGWLSEHGFAGGWPSAFYVAGMIGITTFVLSAPVVTSTPSEHRFVSKVELSLINADRDNEVEMRPSIPWVQILTSKSMFAFVYGKFAIGFLSLMVSAKLPTYYNDILHVAPTENGIVNALQYVVQFVTLPASGPLSEHIISKKWLSRTNTRKAFVAICFFGAGTCIILIPFVGCSKLSVATLMIFANFFMGLDAGGATPIAGEMSLHFPGIIFAIMNTICMSSGFSAPFLAGLILDSGEDIMFQWTVLFVVTGLIAMSGVIVFGLFAEAERQPWDIVVKEQEPRPQCAPKKMNENNGNDPTFNLF